MIRIVIVGAGKMAREYTKVLKTLNYVSIVGVISKNLHSAETFAVENNVPNFGQAEFLTEFLENINPSHVILCIPPQENLAILEKLIGYSYSILVEKPVGINLEESLKIVEISKKGKLKIFPALNRRFLPSILMAKQALNDKDWNVSSQNKFVYVTDQQDTIAARDHGHPQIILDNWHFANGIHMLDLALSFCDGEISTVNSRKVEYTKERYIMHSEIALSSGDKIFYASFWNLYKKWELGISYGEINVFLSPIEVLKLFEKNGKDVLENIAASQSLIYEESVDFKPGIMNVVKCFLELEDYYIDSKVLLAKSHQSMEVLNQIYGLK